MPYNWNMELDKKVWTTDDIAPFREMLISLGGNEKQREFERRIVNTSLPCLAIPSKEINRIVREIYKGNYMSFIDLWMWDSHSETTILCGLISKIDDFETQKKYILKLASTADNWATIDAIKIKPDKKTDKSAYTDFARELTLSDKTFVRRMGIIILLKLLPDEKLLPEIFEISESLLNETEYYVNMANAWLISELYIKHRAQTIAFLERTRLNAFTVNKAISKCRDSYRVSDEDKAFLLKFKR